MVRFLILRCRDLQFGDAAVGFLVPALALSAVTTEGRLGPLAFMAVMMGGFALLTAALFHIVASALNLTMIASIIGLAMILSVMIGVGAGSDLPSLIHLLASSFALTAIVFAGMRTSRAVRTRMGASL